MGAVRPRDRGSIERPRAPELGHVAKLVPYFPSPADRPRDHGDGNRLRRQKYWTGLDVGSSADSDRFRSTPSTDTMNADYEISTDATRLDIARIHEFLAQGYWATGIPPG